MLPGSGPPLCGVCPTMGIVRGLENYPPNWIGRVGWCCGSAMACPVHLGESSTRCVSVSCMETGHYRQLPPLASSQSRDEQVDDGCQSALQTGDPRASCRVCLSNCTADCSLYMHTCLGDQVSCSSFCLERWNPDICEICAVRLCRSLLRKALP